MTIASYNVPQQLTSVRLAAAANISGFYFNGTLNNGVGATLSALNVGQLSIDGVLVNSGDRILLFSQTNVDENGVYIVNKAGGSISLWLLERSADFQSLEQLIAGQFFTVDAGNTLVGNLFVLTEPLPSVIGSGSIGFSFSNVSSNAAPGTYLRADANLSDLQNKLTAFGNLGFGDGSFIVISDSDFVDGVYQLINPGPAYINAIISTSDLSINLPPANANNGYTLSQGPLILLNSLSTNDLLINDFTGAEVGILQTPANAFQLYLGDSSTAAGVWNLIDITLSIKGINSDGNEHIYSGDMQLSSDVLNASLNFTPANYTPVSGTGFSEKSITGYLKGIDETISNEASTLQDAYNNGTSGAQGDITLTSDNNNPIRGIATSTSPKKVCFSAVNSLAGAPSDWGYHWYGLNSASAMVQYGRVEISVPFNTSGSESARMSFYVEASGTSMPGLVILGDSQTTTVPWSFSASGNISCDTVGGAFAVAQGANASAGKGAVMVAGQVTVNTTVINSGDIVLLSCTNSAGTPGIPSYSIVDGVSFTIFSTNVLDTSTYSWVIIKAA